MTLSPRNKVNSEINWTCLGPGRGVKDKDDAITSGKCLVCSGRGGSKIHRPQETLARRESTFELVSRRKSPWRKKTKTIKGGVMGEAVVAKITRSETNERWGALLGRNGEEHCTEMLLTDSRIRGENYIGYARGKRTPVRAQSRWKPWCTVSSSAGGTETNLGRVKRPSVVT